MYCSPALRDPGVRVEAVTVVSGNVPLGQAVENALYTVELCGAADVPVFLGGVHLDEVAALGAVSPLAQPPVHQASLPTGASCPSSLRRRR